ncbi:MAG: HlyC/CorC family transporter [Alphaproteobacteria bacterium]|nr:HlyC/CorC family transporter [Alphaproteobacteria bacterium]
MEEIIIILLLILLNGVFAMSEIALISARKSNLQTEANKGDKRAKRVLNLQENPDRFLSSVQIGITLIGLLTGMFSGNKISAMFAQVLTDLGINQGVASAIAQTIIIIVVTFLSIVLGELVPKRIGMNAAEKVAKRMVGPMNFISKVTKPIVWLLSKSTYSILRVIGVKDQESKITEEEIKSMIQEGTEDGEVLPVEQDIVERVFTLGDLSVSSIMTLRSDIVWLEKNMSETEIRQNIEQNLYEEYPVADNDLDHIIGILRLKDFVVNIGKENFCLEKMLVKPTYFHENMNVYAVLEQMKSKQVSRALICDEFGSCCGLITHKDILEALIGDMNDDVEESPSIVERVGGDGWLVEGNCLMYDFLDYFDIDDETNGYEYTTIAGLIIDEVGHIPDIGACIEWNDFSFEIVDMDGPRIDKVIVKRLYESK